MSAAIKRKNVAEKSAADKSSSEDMMIAWTNIINVSTSIINAANVTNTLVNVNRPSFLSIIVLVVWSAVVVSAVAALKSVSLAIPAILPAHAAMKSNGFSGMSRINRKW